mgnify:CR=1 FL=1
MSNKSLAGEHNAQTILVTGGAGFIGSHTCVELLEQNYNVVILDDLSNSCVTAVDRIRELSGANADQLKFVEASILDREACERVFSENDIDAIIHFAGFKAVGESTQKPLEYYWNNVAGSLVLFDVARNHGVKNIIFSSSATVYGEPEMIPITEECPLHEATNPYGETKVMLERILTDFYRADSEWNVVLLRYFNPIGAHISGRIGEDPKDIPNNLLPYVAQVAVGKLECIQVFGNDYPTPDGTGVRDYIHVTDLATGHMAALDYAASHTGVEVFNLGTGTGYSVLDMVHAFEKANGVKVPYQIVGRRPGDLPTCYADPAKSERVLGWKAEKNLEDMCRDSWNWQSKNPMGYGE